MTIRTIACIDVETTGLLPETDRIVEVGCVVWSVEQRCILYAWSALVAGDGNAAEAINRIPTAALSQHGDVPSNVFANLRAYANRVDALVAHRAEFDRSFLEAAGFRSQAPWICSKFDIEWPRSKVGDGLVSTALAHGVGVTRAHRALTDCLTLAYLFERVAESHDLGPLLERALRPKATFQAIVSYDDREMAKSAGFQWDGAKKRWTRRMAVEDAGALGFRTQEVQP
jgi:DNA polymerase III subunit epsilon